MGTESDPSHITDHAFTPKGEWWRVCAVCGFAESAHRDTLLTDADRDMGKRPRVS